MTRAGAVAVMVGIAVTLAGCGGSPASHRHDAGPATTSTTGTRTSAADTAAGALHPDLGPFAGYTWNGDVNSAHADWTVPRLLPSSAQGEAATWIGAEAPGPRRGAPFVQVGVNEGDTDGAGAAFYYAFYSTTRLHFHPVHLFGVRPEDEISATLRRSGASWQINIDYDHSTVDTVPASISDAEISWHTADGQNFRLDRKSGDLTVILASSTGGAFLYDRCKLAD